MTFDARRENYRKIIRNYNNKSNYWLFIIKDVFSFAVLLLLMSSNNLQIFPD